MKQTLEQKQDEKGRLLKAYRANERAKWAAMCEQEPRLLEAKSFIRRSDKTAPLALWLAESWVRFAPTDIRFAVLRLIQKQSERMQRAQGRETFADPLPPETNLYFVARSMLAVR